MSQTLNLVAILDDMNPSAVWKKLSMLDYIEETEEGLSFVAYDRIKSKKLKEHAYKITLNGIRNRGYLKYVSQEKIEKILNFKTSYISRPLFGLMPDQRILTFTFETDKGFGVEFVEYMLDKTEKDLGIEFEPAEEYELEDFNEENETRNLELLKKIAENEGEYDTWEDDDDEDYPQRYVKDTEEYEKTEESDTNFFEDDKKDKKKDNPFW